MVYFINWSFCLILLSAALGVAVSLRYLILSYHIKHTVVHGRPGLTPQRRASQHSCACFGTNNTSRHTDDVEHGLMLSNAIEPSATHTDHNDMHVEWAMQAPEQESTSAAQVNSSMQPGRSHSSSAQPAEAAFAKAHGHTRTPSDLDSLAPAELRYAPQVLLPLCSFVLGTFVLGSAYPVILLQQCLHGTGFSCTVLHLPANSMNHCCSATA